MNEMVLASFKHRDNAEKAVSDLKGNGFEAKDISVVMQDKEQAKEVAGSSASSVGSGATTGALAGGALGALAGLLVGVGAIAFPGLGSLLVAGPIAAALGLGGTVAGATLSGGTLGAVAGGLVGALTGLGVPEEEAERYESTIREGGVLVAVPVHYNGVFAKELLQKHHADQIRNVQVNS